MTEQLWKARDVAAFLGLEMSTVLDRFEAGDLPGFRLYGRKGGPVRFRRAELEEWLESRCRTTMRPTNNRAGDACHVPAPAPEVGPDAFRILRPLEPDA